MRLSISLLCASLVAVAFASLAMVDDAMAGEQKRDSANKHRILKKFDANQDGALSQDEVPAKLWERISKADANQDGSVTKDEAKAFRAARRDAATTGEGRARGNRKARGRRAHRRQHRRMRRVGALRRLDKNEDGALASTEVPEAMWARVVNADADSNGLVTKDELKAFAKVKRAERKAQREANGETVGAGRKVRGGNARGGKDGAGKGKGKRGRRGQRGRRLFKRLDKNEDGALTQDEVPAKLWERISQADSDGNGGVTKEELKAFRKAKRGERDK